MRLNHVLLISGNICNRKKYLEMGAKLMSGKMMDRDSVRKLIHDLRGPVVSLRGFQAELKEAIDLLQVEINGSQEQGDNRGKLNSLFDDDLIPIMNYMSMSICQMFDRLELLENGPPIEPRESIPMNLKN